MILGVIIADYAEVYQHDMSEIITEEYGGRWIIFSVDNEQVIAGVVSQEESSRAAWTAHTGLVTPITEVILHDLYIVEIMDEFRERIEEKFGKNLVKLQQKYLLYRGDNT